MKNFLKQIRGHKIDFAKSLMIVLALGAFIFAGIIYANSQATKARQTKQAQQSVANHTETLDEIASAVTQLKQNNQINHDTTIRYLQCLANLVEMASQGQVITQVNLDDCTSVSGLIGTPTDSATSSNTSPLKTSTNAVPTTQPSPAQPQPTPATANTTPASKPDIIQRVINKVKSIL